MERESKVCWHGWKNTTSTWNQSYIEDAPRQSLHQDDECCGRQDYWNDWKSAFSSWVHAHNDYATAVPRNLLSEFTPKQQATWEPYWVKCKSHGWQQCPACIAEIASTRYHSPKPTITWLVIASSECARIVHPVNACGNLMRMRWTCLKFSCLLRR